MSAMTPTDLARWLRAQGDDAQHLAGDPEARQRYCAAADAVERVAEPEAHIDAAPCLDRPHDVDTAYKCPVDMPCRVCEWRAALRTDKETP